MWTSGYALLYIAVLNRHRTSMPQTRRHQNPHVSHSKMKEKHCSSCIDMSDPTIYMSPARPVVGCARGELENQMRPVLCPCTEGECW